METTLRLRWKWWVLLLLVIALAAAYIIWSLKRPLPKLAPQQAVTQRTAKAPAGSLAWPANGQAAVALPGSDILQTNGPQKPLPIASTAKLMTALTVLREKPLKPGEQGPLITLGPSDVALYNAYTAQGGSVVRVTAGEKISEYQMLQAIMLPSANNMADSLAIWAFGSLNNYAAEANKYADRLGLHDTHIGTDASGLSPTTTSTARDLAKLGEAAMQNPVLAQIVGQPTADGLPLVNTVKNVNFLLGTDNIIGIKTGNTEEAGGVFVGAATTTVNGKKVTLVSAVLGSPSLFAAMKDSLNLINSAQTNFKPVTLVKAGDTVGSYVVPWGSPIPVKAGSNLDVNAWAGSTVTADVSLRTVPASGGSGRAAGTVTLPESALTNGKSVSANLSGTAGKPSVWWRLLHPF